MIPHGLFTQIGMIIISIVIVVTYIKPIFNDIGSMQNDIALYKEKRASVASVNEKLASLVSRLDRDVSTDDKRRLFTYMPDEVDSISVVRDLFLISKLSGVAYVDAQYSGEIESVSSRDSSEEVKPSSHLFNLSVEGTYDQIKTLVNNLEINNYPLELRELSINQLEGGFLSANLTLMTYQYKADSLNSNKKIEF